VKYKIGDKVILKDDVLCRSGLVRDVIRECNNVVTIESLGSNTYFMEEIGWFYLENEIIGLYTKPKAEPETEPKPIHSRFEILDL
jgi:hypothetical protein